MDDNRWFDDMRVRCYKKTIELLKENKEFYKIEPGYISIKKSVYQQILKMAKECGV